MEVLKFEQGVKTLEFFLLLEIFIIHILLFLTQIKVNAVTLN